MVASKHCYIHPARDCNAAGVEAKIGQTKHHGSILLARRSLEFLQLVMSIRYERYVLAADDAQKLDTFLGLGNPTAAKRAGDPGVSGVSTVALELAASLLATCAFPHLEWFREREEGVLPPYRSAMGFDCGSRGRRDRAQGRCESCNERGANCGKRVGWSSA